MKPRTIHLDIQTFAAYQRLILEGIVNYWHRHRPGWRFSFYHWPTADPVMRMKQLKDIDGIISHGPDQSIATYLSSIEVPVVLIEQKPANVTLPLINADNDKIARMAFEHLRDKGFRRFACSSLDAWPMNERAAAFDRVVTDAGLGPVDQFTIDPSSPSMFPGQRDALRKWVADLRKPIGLFCANVAESWRVVEACHQLRVHVPDEVAVIGCDKDDVTCALTHPPLSTIDHGMEHAGYEAAALLHRLMDGEPAPTETILIPPVGVIERQSSDTLAIEDTNVRDAVRFIREAALRSITPADVVDQVLVGRRRLEMRFKEVVGRTIQQQIVHERVEHARHLLINTDLSLVEIGRRCCFDHVSRLSEAFTRVIGTPPSVYRREARRNAG